MVEQSTPKASPLLELTRARMLEFVREPEALFWVFGFPIVMAVALGFAFRDKGPEKIPVGVLEGPSAAVTMKALEASPGLLPRLYGPEEGRDRLRVGRISLLVEPDATPGGPTYHFDPTRPDARAARMEVDDALQRAAGRTDPVVVADTHVTEPGARYIDFLIPGLLGLNLMGTGMWGVGYAVVNARTRKLLKRLVATPMRKSHYLLAHIISRLAFLVFEVGVLVGFGWAVFGVGVHGSLPLFALICLLGAMSFSGIGLLTASRTRTVEGLNGLANLVMIPMWLLSGVFFSYERFPDAMQPFIKLLPLTVINDALRAVMTEGHGLVEVAPQIGLLAGYGVVAFWLAVRLFRWK